MFPAAKKLESVRRYALATPRLRSIRVKDDARRAAPEISRGLIALISFACGAMVANIYYAQTLIERIGPEIGLSAALSGAIVTLTQLGYGVGLLLFVPLGDLYENRRLSLLMIGGTFAACLAIALSRGPAMFLLASLVTGIAATGAQILLPLASHLSPPERQGRTIGQVMSGLLAGIMLARPLASFMAEAFGWRSVFYFSAALMAVIAVALWATLPERRPRARMSYCAILRSMASLTRKHRRLRLRALYQAALFAAFNLFWTAAPLVLLRRFHFTQNGVALFALAGAGGALSAPLAGWMADRGKTRLTTLLAHILLVGGFLVAGFVVAAGMVIAFAATAFVIDAAVQLNQITGQKIIFDISQEARSRVNSVYLTSMFAIGATGSVIGSLCYDRGGWGMAAAVGAGIGGASMLVFLVAERGGKAGGIFSRISSSEPRLRSG